MILNLQNIYKDYQQDKLVVPVLKDVCLTVDQPFFFIQLLPKRRRLVPPLPG